MIDLEYSKYAKKAMENFKEGYNCSQSVMLAYEDKMGLDRETILKISSSFGGGMGRLREVCGAVSGIFMVAGMLYGYTETKDIQGKTEHYKRIQELAAEFSSITGSIVCRELLGLAPNDKKESYVPSERTEEYYRKRPCVEMVGMAAAVLEEYIQKNSDTISDKS